MPCGFVWPRHSTNGEAAVSRRYYILAQPPRRSVPVCVRVPGLRPVAIICGLIGVLSFRQSPPFVVVAVPYDRTLY